MSQSESKYLYVGCGAHRIPGFHHVEINIGKERKKGRHIPPPEILADITRHIPLPDGSVKLIFSRATLEHLTYLELINHFLECYRLLEVDGMVRMTVPDLDIMVKNYQEQTEDLERAIAESEVSERLPIENHTDLFISRLLYHDHYYLHNFDTLKRALNKTGFGNVQRKKPGETLCQELSPQLLQNVKATFQSINVMRHI
ncbi:MAG: class I SAM-dependent methyltransferase [Gammaproteobacteria bacterium]|nr:class I SAM-dependent methyltransferase [Gammaproteobacteria bacterium]MDH5652063.1 class I SAM-dependent methyltransferase [Gammaproteobacteria bacterium]